MDTVQYAFDRIGREVDGNGLEIAAPDGRRWRVGHGQPRASIELRRPGTLRRILLNPPLAFGETYVDGGWEPGRGGLLGVMEACHRIVGRRRTIGLLSRLHEWNNAQRARRNVAHHYDLDTGLFRTFLDREMHYSCGYFREPGATLEQAQAHKCAHIAAKLDLRHGARVLDVGCGYGSLAIHLAERHGAQVTGVTLSQRQLEEGRRRVSERGLDGRVELLLKDYRDVRGEFDAVVSVGMFEHVGQPQYREFFRRVRKLLRAHGTALLHTIGVTTEPGRVNPWIRKYIFPGGYLPSASELTAAIEPSGLLLTDLEVWRRHYAETLAEWNRRFQAAWPELNGQFDERFRRMWTFYLTASEAAFRVGKLVVYQAQLTRDPYRLPITRGYLYR